MTVVAVLAVGEFLEAGGGVLGLVGVTMGSAEGRKATCGLAGDSLRNVGYLGL